MAISARKLRKADPSNRVVLVLGGAMLAILCLLVLVAAALNGSGSTQATQAQPTISAAQGSGEHARSEQKDAGTTGSSAPDNGDRQTGHGFLP